MNEPAKANPLVGSSRAVETPTIEPPTQPARAISKRGRPRLYHSPEEAKAAIRAQQKMYRERRRQVKQAMKENTSTNQHDAATKLDGLPKTEAEAQLNVTIEYFRTISRKLREFCRDIDDYVARADQAHSQTKKAE